MPSLSAGTPWDPLVAACVLVLAATWLPGWALAGEVGPGHSGVSFVPQATTLTVALKNYPLSNVTAQDDQMVWLAQVNASGIPLSGATVVFTDSFGSSFTPSTISTNATGWVVTTMKVAQTNGVDKLNVTASDPGYLSGYAINYSVTVLPSGTAQLAVEGLSLTDPADSSGSSDLISGYVYDNCGSCSGVSGATVALSDTGGAAFASTTLVTNSNGYFWTNLTLPPTKPVALDFFTATATASGMSGTASSTYTTVDPPSSTTLTVKLNRFFPSAGITTAQDDNMVWLAQVTAGGVAVSGATASFSDSFNSAFTPSSATTNASGWAVVTMKVAQTSGWDTVSVIVADTGYLTGYGANMVNVLPNGASQLTVWALAVTDPAQSSGSSDVLTGYVYDNCGSCSGVSGATVTLSDSLGPAFASTTLVSDSAGFFWTNLTYPTISGVRSIFITATATDTGMSGTASSIYSTVDPPSSTTLSVALNRFYPRTGITTAQDDNMVWLVHVTAGAAAISGATATFSDSFSSGFSPSSVTTNASGWALTTMKVAQASGWDTVSVSVADTGYLTGYGANMVDVLPGGASQLTVYGLSVANLSVYDGSVDLVSGYVYDGCGSCSGVTGATVTIGDSLGGMISPATVATITGGYFSTNLTAPSITGSQMDFLTATASETGMGGSSSTAFVTVTKNSGPLLASVAVSPATLTLRTQASYSFSAVPSCSLGACPAGISYAWTLSSGLGTVSPATGSTTTFTAGSSAGTVKLTVEAGLNGKNVWNNATVTVSTTAAPNLVSVRVSPTIVTLGVSGTQVFNATPQCSGGTCLSGIVYAWYLSNSFGTLNSTGGVSTTFTAGSQLGLVILRVTASQNGTTVGSNAVNITIAASTPVSNSTGFLGLPGEDGIILVVVVVVVIVVAVVALVSIRRKGRRAREQVEAPLSSTAPSPATTAPSTWQAPELQTSGPSVMSVPSPRCTSCGAPVDPGASVCPKCGSVIRR